METLKIYEIIEKSHENSYLEGCRQSPSDSRFFSKTAIWTVDVWKKTGYFNGWFVKKWPFLIKIQLKIP